MEIKQIDQGIEKVHRDKTRNAEVQCKLQLIENTKSTRKRFYLYLKRQIKTKGCEGSLIIVTVK